MVGEQGKLVLRHCLPGSGLQRAVHIRSGQAAQILAISRNSRTQELVDLAKAIGKADPPVGIPASILEVIKDVITGRTVCAEWYDSQPHRDDLARQNEGHVYFISILKHVQDLLTSVAHSPTAPETAAKKQKAKKKRVVVENDGLSNLFACLEIE